MQNLENKALPYVGLAIPPPFQVQQIGVVVSNFRSPAA
jgi:hypothetical protein